MTWNEIPRMISTEHCYHVNTGIRGYVKWIEDEQLELGLQLKPRFQREEVWKESQQIKYIEYLLMGGQSGRAFYFNWPNAKEGNYNDYVCVDGLQRTTAIKRFLNNEIKVFHQYYREFGKELVRTEYQIDIYVNSLKTKKDVYTWYIEMNSGGTPHTQEEIDRVVKMREEEF